MTNGGLQAVVGVTSLEILDLGFCPRIDQQGFKALSGLSHLKQLHLGGLNLCRAVLQALSHLTGEVYILYIYMYVYFYPMIPILDEADVTDHVILC